VKKKPAKKPATKRRAKKRAMMRDPIQPAIAAALTPSQPAGTAAIARPEDLTGDQVQEWDRICGELQTAAGEVNAADRSILIQYVQTWSINRSAAEHVNRYGTIIKWPNGQPGPSPFYKAWKETTALMRGLLSDLGLTPATRKPVAKEEDSGELDLT
jgi:P27 family predicted phage terminase small subunit